MNETTKTKPAECFKFSAYTLPLGSEFVLGKRRWKLMWRDAGHPDHMMFRETSEGASTPDRVMNPPEVDALFRLGVEFMVPMRFHS